MSSDNPVYARDMHVTVWVDEDWLTNDGDDDQEGGWKELENQLRYRINSLPIPGVYVSFEEWLDGPETETSEHVLRMVQKGKR